MVAWPSYKQWLCNSVKGGGKMEKFVVKITRFASGNHPPGYIQQSELQVERLNSLSVMNILKCTTRSQGRTLAIFELTS